MTPIEQIIEGANATATVNLNFKAIRGAFVGAFNQAESIDLTMGLYGGDWNGLNVAADTVTLIDDDTNYVVMDMSDGTFSVDIATTDWDDDTDFKRICEITTASGGFVENNIKDWRYSPGGLFYGDSGTAGGTVDSVVQGNGITVDSTDPANPIVTAKPQSFSFACSDETTALTTGVAKVTWRTPYAFTLTGVRASVTTAPTGSTLIVDINESGSTILSTKLSIDASEKTSTTAASAAVISDTSLANDAEITIDIDQIGSTVAGAGLKVTLIGYPT